ncbi:MAG TPA: helix-turn-helix transcriptional regulator [Tepidisphaeraceae bacterium]|nr:helix-turn-helix transcriptional regulator [Tepidisphaeraceae bacterium]
MARKYSELRQKMTPASRAAAKEKTRELLNDMLLGELRRLSGKTQSELAEALGIRQPTLSRLEAQDDMQISTLQRIVRALGGELEIIARMPHGKITIRQFDDAAA